ncbi:hypothetical protein JCM3765_002410 [Sporobolomyces pararoseus]
MAPSAPRKGNPRSTRERRSVSYADPKDGSESSEASGESDQNQEEEKPEEEEEQEEDDDVEGEKQASTSKGSAVKRRPAKKPRRSVALGTRKSRAKKPQLSLSGMVDELPLDVLASIFGAGDLQSLFYLSRLNKKLRAFLLNPSMVGVWKSCWKNSELPDSIEFTPRMNILKWCNVLYGDCQVCGSKTQNSDPYLQIKACATPKKCAANLTIQENKLDHFQFARRDYVANGPSKVRSARPIYLVSDLKEAQEGFAAADAATKEGGESGTFEHSRFGPIPLKNFADNLKALVQKQYSDGKAIDQWFTSQKSKQSNAKSQVRQQRVQDIKARFIELGFEERHFLGGFFEHKQVRAARPLTENTWPGVYAALLPILEETRHVMTERELEPIRMTRLISLATQYELLLRNVDSAKRAGLFPLASWDDYQNLESFKALYLPAEAEVVPTTLFDNGPTLAREIQLKKQSLSGEFFSNFRLTLSVLESTRQTIGQDEPYLESGKWLREDFSEEEQTEVLETCLAIFACIRCDSLDTFPQILNHQCVGSAGGVAPLRPGSYHVRTASLKTLVQVIGVSPLKDSVEVDETGMNDLKPLRIQHERLEELGNGFSCTKCPPSFDSLARNWLGITEHLVKGIHPTAPESLSAYIVYEPPSVAQLRLLKAHEDYHNTRRGVYSEAEQ